jgi:hypothetical protein
LKHGVIAVLLSLCTALPAAALSVTPDPAATVTFLPRYVFHLTAEHLSSDDERFTWDANYGGELDIVDYGAGRFTFYANYQVITGDQLRAFDANQGNYILGGRLSGRIKGTEVAGVFHHVSRHLSDRPKPFPVDWNMLGVRVSRPLTVGRVSLDPRVDIRGVVQHSYVDYEWELDGGIRARYPINGFLAIVGGGDVRVLGVDDTGGRDTQTGGRGEGGVRFQGKLAAVELFLAVERRIDPYPLDFDTDTWWSAGFKLLSK